MLILHHSPQKPGFIVSFFSSSIVALMGSKQLLKHGSLSPLQVPSSSSLARLFGVYRLHSSAIPLRPSSQVPSFRLRSNGAPYYTHVNVPRPVNLEGPGQKSGALGLLHKRLEELGIDMDDCHPGQHNHLLCPSCKGGSTIEKSLNLFISPDGGSAEWQCFRGNCGWKGSTKASANSSSTVGTSNLINKVKRSRELTTERLELKPLCNELIAYFSNRAISVETLRRNAVMQKTCGDQVVIAFPYYRKGELVSCKYRTVHKKFWQEADTEKIFYGVDDIDGQNDIIIVEGEMDKLAMEEAGFRNCVSVPDGAPPQVSSKDVPPEEQVCHKL